MEPLGLNYYVLSYLRRHPGSTVLEIHAPLRHYSEYSVRSSLCRLRQRGKVFSAPDGKGLLGYWADEPPTIDFSDVPQTWLHRQWVSEPSPAEYTPKWY